MGFPFWLCISIAHTMLASRGVEAFFYFFSSTSLYAIAFRRIGNARMRFR
jgi:hypothetical protein